MRQEISTSNSISPVMILDLIITEFQRCNNLIYQLLIDKLRIMLKNYPYIYFTYVNL